MLFYNALYLKKHAVKQLLCGHDGKSLSKKKKKYQTIFIVYSSKGQKKKSMSVQKDANIWKSWSRPLKPSQPFQPYKLQWEG